MEDEFSIVCGWLGRCDLVHKLDQKQHPAISNATFQVPDLLASFTLPNGEKKTILIEVKSCAKNVMSFKPDYISKLKSYGSLLNLPVMVAWKKFGLWSLVSLDEFKLATKNYNLSFTDALSCSHMGSLLGDFNYSLWKGAGIHLRLDKERLVDSPVGADEVMESWQMRITEVDFFNGLGEKVENLSPLAQQVFHTWELEPHEVHHNTHIDLNYFNNSTDVGMFAHAALSKLLAFHNTEENIRWRNLLGDSRALRNIENFRAGIQENLEAKIVHHVFDYLPRKGSVEI